MAGSFKDHFSAVDGYAAYRPAYPAELFVYLAGLVPATETVWDCATGSGQAARGFAPHFSRVVATDASLRQMSRAERPLAFEHQAFQRQDFQRIAASAEAAPLKPASVDLISVGQALHWFDFDGFYAEVRRVAKPGGILAAWTYPFFSAGADVDPQITHFADQIVEPYWPAERRYVDSRYRDLPFPFPRLDAPKFSMSVDWTLEDVVGYFGTWSAVSRYRQQNAEDPVAQFAESLEPHWGERRRVTWDLPMLVGRVE